MYLRTLFYYSTHGNIYNYHETIVYIIITIMISLHSFQFSILLKQILKKLKVYLNNIREIRTRSRYMQIHYIQCDICTHPYRHNLHLKNN